MYRSILHRLRREQAKIQKHRILNPPRNNSNLLITGIYCTLFMNFTCIYICIYSPSNGFTDPILTKRLPSLHPAALISDQYPALCRLPYSLYSLSNDFDTLVPAGNQKGEKWCQIPSYIHVLCIVCTKVIFYIQCIKHVYILHAKKYNVTYYV